MNPHPVPFRTAVLQLQAGGGDDGLPASYRKPDPKTRRRTVAPVEDVQDFLQEELSLGNDREVDVNDGSFYWRYNGQPLLDENGEWVRDTKPMRAAQGEQGEGGAAPEVSYTATVAGPSTTY